MSTFKIKFNSFVTVDKIGIKESALIQGREVEDYVLFSDGSALIFHQERDCCEYGYAALEEMKDQPFLEQRFDHLYIELVEGYGFRIFTKIGDAENTLCSVPCYSYSNGCYTIDLDMKYVRHKKIYFQVLMDYCMEHRDQDHKGWESHKPFEHIQENNEEQVSTSAREDRLFELGLSTFKSFVEMAGLPEKD